MESTGGTIGNHLNVHKKEIIELANQGNTYAQNISNYFGWLNKKYSQYDILKEVSEYLEQHKEDKITSYSTISDRLESTGGTIGNYLSRNKQKIIELAEQGRIYAAYICKYFKWKSFDEASQEFDSQSEFNKQVEKVKDKGKKK